VPLVVVKATLATLATLATSCPEEHTTFTILTGFVFRDPEAILTTKPGVLELGTCLSSCRLLPACRSVNYETGLCVTFSTSAKDRPGSLATSEFPVFTMYGERTCLQGACARPWSFELVPSSSLSSHTRESLPSSSSSHCMEACLASPHFTCRSATYQPSTGTCSLSEVDRHSLADVEGGRAGWASGVQDSIYLESNCVQDVRAKLCDFRPVSGKILKTVDSVHQQVSSLRACQELCLNADYRCHSFDWGETGEGVCRLSHQSSSSLGSVAQPYLAIPSAVTHEMAACFNVSVSCTGEGMVAQVRTSRLFSGRVYSRARPHSCAVDVQDSLDFHLHIGYRSGRAGKFSS